MRSGLGLSLKGRVINDCEKGHAPDETKERLEREAVKGDDC